MNSVAYFANLAKPKQLENLDKQKEQLLEPYLEIDGNFILLNPTDKEVANLGEELDQNDPKHPSNQSSMFGFGSSIRE